MSGAGKACVLLVLLSDGERMAGGRYQFR